MSRANRAAQEWAKTRLSYRHPERFRQLCVWERGPSSGGSRARHNAHRRAKTRLAAEYPTEYVDLVARHRRAHAPQDAE